MKGKFGLVLGAGGGRGFAHIGVLQVLKENGIEPDILTGCSMGSLIGSLYASGADIYFLEKYAKSFDIMQYVDLSIKDGGFFRGKKIETLIRMLTKNMNIEDTALPFSCVAVDIQTGEVKEFHRGKMWQAVRASISIPGIFKPYEIDGHLYVDGGVLERLPITAAKTMGADKILAVDVNYRGQVMDRPKNIIEMLMHTMNIADWYITQEKEKAADLLLAPDVYEVDPMSSKDAALAIERGRESTIARIDEIKAMLEA